MRKIFWPVIVAGDPTRNHLARLFHAFLITSGCLVLILSAVLLVVDVDRLYQLVIPFALLPPLIGLIWLTRRGFVDLAVWIYLGIFWVVSFTLAIEHGGLLNPNLAAFQIVLALVAGAFLGRRPAIVVSIFMAALELLLVYLTISGMLPWPLPGESPLAIWIAHTAALFLAVVLLNLATSSARDMMSYALKEQEARQSLETIYRRAISAADAIPYSINYTQDRFDYVGEGILALTGYSVQDLTTAEFRSHIEKVEIHGELFGIPLDEAKERIRRGQTTEWKADYAFRTRSGELRWISDSSVQVSEQPGPPSSAIGVFSDITERKRAESTLRERELLFRAIFEKSAAGIALCDQDGKILEANLAFQNFLGYTLNELRQTQLSMISHPDDLPLELENVERLLAGELVYFQMEKRYLRKDSAVAWARMTASTIPDETDKPRYGLVIIDDISERRRAEAALSQRDAILEAVAFAATRFLQSHDWRRNIMVILSLLGEKTGASHAYVFENHLSQHGRMVASQRYEWCAADAKPEINEAVYQNSEVNGPGQERWYAAMSRGDLFYGNTATMLAGEIEAVAPTGARSIIETPIYVNGIWWGFIGVDDHRSEREWTAAELDAFKIAAGIIGAAIERQQADEALRQLNAELEQRVRQRTAELEVANQEMQTFAYTVSHDLRAPLRAVDGYSKLLALDFADSIGPDGREILDNIRLATQKMSLLIDDLLKLSRVTRAEMKPAPVDISEIARRILENLQSEQPERSVDIHVQPELIVQGDPALLQVAMDNLLRNAWKFTGKTPNARIEVGSLTQPDTFPILPPSISGRIGAVHFVRDNGAGFDMKYIEKLFGAFQRLHNPDEFEGTGIGLATVRRIIQRHGGDIWAEGATGQGAVFYFIL